MSRRLLPLVPSLVLVVNAHAQPVVPVGAPRAPVAPRPKPPVTLPAPTPPPPPTPPVTPGQPPYHFDDARDVAAWTRDGSFAGDAVRRCPATNPRRSDTIAATAETRRLGGNYWMGPLPDDGNGCWLESGAGRGRATTPELTVTDRYLHFRLGGTPVTRVELHAKFGAGFIKVRDWFGDGSGLPSAVVHDLEETYPGSFTGKQIKLVLKDDSDASSLQLDEVRFAASAAPAGPPPPVWGFVDLHTHPVNQMGFGGALFHGSIHPSLRNDGTIDASWTRSGKPAAAVALPQCTVAHGSAPGGGTLMVVLEWGHHATGYPDFIGWPHHQTKIHQQMYVEWLRRAWAGGLRVMHADVGNNHLLAQAYAAHPLLRHDKLPNPTDDEWNIVYQVKAMKELVRLTDVAAFAEIAYSAADARRIVGAGKLAIVLGVEVEDFGNFTKTLAGKSDAEARPIIQSYLRELHAAGVRHVFPIHLTNNAFGGTAVYEMMFLAANLLDRGEMVKIRNAAASGVRLRLDQKLGLSDPTLDELLKLPGLTRFRDQLRAELKLDESPLGHANRDGLSSHGRVLLQELMKMGFIIDVDHMSELAADETIRIASHPALRYPLVSSHTAVRELMVVPDERARTREQLQKIRALGGMVGLGTGRATSTRAVGGRAANDCHGTSKSFAQYYLQLVDAMGGRGVALGTDMNGLPDSLGPRFGTQACPAPAPPPAPTRRDADAAAQRGNGIRYAGAHQHNFGRFQPGGKGAPYGDVEAMAWAAIERFEAGLGADLAGDLIVNPNLRNVSRMAHGFYRAQRGLPLMADKLPDTYHDVRVAHQVFEQIRDNRPTTDPDGVRIRAAWAAYHAVEGANPPLEKSRLGTTDFDFNLDGLAHYGLLPDLLQDLRNIGLREEDLVPLFRGAEDYVQMWERIEAQSVVAQTHRF